MKAMPLKLTLIKKYLVQKTICTHEKVDMMLILIQVADIILYNYRLSHNVFIMGYVTLWGIMLQLVH